MAYALRVRDDASGFYRKHRGYVCITTLRSREEAEDVRLAMVNGSEFEVVEVEP